MNQKLAVFEDFDRCITHADMAMWLLTMPIATLISRQDPIINRCRNKHFLDGVAYVEHMLVALRMPRDGSYYVNAEQDQMFRDAQRLMWSAISSDAAKRRDEGAL